MTAGTRVSCCCQVMVELVRWCRRALGSRRGWRGHRCHLVWCGAPQASQEAVSSHKTQTVFYAAGSLLAWLFQHLMGLFACSCFLF